jgi:hypothetical protein
MGGFRKFLSGGASLGALFASIVSRPEKKREPFAPTKRKPEFRRRNAVASFVRNERRLAARAQYERQLRKEREIGVDPIFLHSDARAFAMPRQAWLKKSREWDQRNGKRANNG